MRFARFDIKPAIRNNFKKPITRSELAEYRAHRTCAPVLGELLLFSRKFFASENLRLDSQ